MESKSGRPLHQCTCNISSGRSPISPTVSCKWSCTSGRSRFAKALRKRLNSQRPRLHDKLHQRCDKLHWHQLHCHRPTSSLRSAYPTLLMPPLMRRPLASQSTLRFARFSGPQHSRSPAAGSYCRRCIYTYRWGRIPRGSLPRTTESCSHRPCS